jgi:hypothetical protein
MVRRHLRHRLSKPLGEQTEFADALCCRAVIAERPRFVRGASGAQREFQDFMFDFHFVGLLFYWVVVAGLVPENLKDEIHPKGDGLGAFDARLRLTPVRLIGREFGGLPECFDVAQMTFQNLFGFLEFFWVKHRDRSLF